MVSLKGIKWDIGTEKVRLREKKKVGNFKRERLGCSSGKGMHEKENGRVLELKR